MEYIFIAVHCILIRIHPTIALFFLAKPVCVLCLSSVIRHEIAELQGQITTARERYKDNITTSTVGKLSAIPIVSHRAVLTCASTVRGVMFHVLSHSL